MPKSTLVECAVQGTNDSAAKSKCSMENANYFPEYASYMKYFVDQPDVKRSALINRVEAIRSVLDNWLNREGKKQVLSIGAGFDSTFFVLKDRMADCLYVELDFDPVVKTKKELIQKNNLLDTNNASYYILPFDLRNVKDLNAFLTTNSQFSFEVPTLIISECVLTYLPPEDSNLIISVLAQQFKEAAYLQYEQILYPENSFFPHESQQDDFCTTMINHFCKLQSPIQSIMKYPSIYDVKRRFIDLGWTDAYITSLSKYWHVGFSDAEKERILSLEMFDEWEDWDVKLSHYYIMIATKNCSLPFKRLENPRVPSTKTNEACILEGISCETFVDNCQLDLKRFGHSATKINQNIFIFGGFGTIINNLKAETRRLSDPVLFDLADFSMKKLEFADIKSRIFHTCTEYNGELYVFGGRSAPNNAFSDLWKISFENSTCTQLKSAPSSCYRHSACLVGDNMIIFGGLGHQSVMRYNFKNEMWNVMNCIGDEFTWCHSHSCNVDEKRNSAYIIGGLDKFGNPLNQVLELRFNFLLNQVQVTNINLLINKNIWKSKIATRQDDFPARYSHQSFNLNVENSSDLFVCVIGGLSGIDGAVGLYPENTALIINMTKKHWFPLILSHEKIYSFVNTPVVLDGDNIYMIGGGFTCFSMGTFFDSSYKINMSVKSILINEMQQIPILVDPSPEQFQEMYSKRSPFIMKSVNLGNAEKLWTSDYLIEKCGDLLISSHVGGKEKLSFLHRNFEFQVMKFREFLDNLENDQAHSYYLRSIGENPRKQVADFNKSFPSIANDFKMPIDLIPELKDRFFSSIFRINSGNFHLWTHYDVMDNILCQISGIKKVILWKPEDLPYLYVEGSSSRIIDLDSDALHQDFPLYKHSSPITALLGPGDVLMLPALWFHNVETIQGCSIALNIFWKHLSDEFYSKKDLYGNRDLEPAVAACAKMEQVIGDLERLPKYYREFYVGKVKQILDQFE